MQTARMLVTPLEYMSRLRRDLGPVFTIRMVPYGSGVVCASDPATIKEVLTDQERFAGGDAAAMLAPVVGEHSLIVTPEPPHLRNRRLLLPAFHGERIGRWAERVRELVAAQAESLIGGEAVAVRPWAQRVTLDVILRVVFGIDDPARVGQFRAALDRFLTLPMQGLLFAPAALRRDRGPLSPGRILTRRREAVDTLIYAELAARRAEQGKAERDDVLAVLLEARDEEGRGFSDEELRDELMGLVIAGHETTATALSWTLHLLAQNPEARDALIEDLDAGSDELLKATIKESMRLRAPVFDAIRMTKVDTSLGGWTVPAGSYVSALFCVMQLEEELWPDPLAFRPKRHLSGKPAPYALTPFGGGVRRCLGAELANLELEVALREVLGTAVPDAAGPPEAVRLFGVTLVPAKGGRVLLRRRSSKRTGVRAREASAD